jgi:hypothetical protein
MTVFSYDVIVRRKDGRCIGKSSGSCRTLDAVSTAIENTMQSLGSGNETAEDIGSIITQIFAVEEM